MFLKEKQRERERDPRKAHMTSLPHVHEKSFLRENISQESEKCHFLSRIISSS